MGIDYLGQSWNERTANLQPENSTVLEPNVAILLIGGMWLAN